MVITDVDVRLVWSATYDALGETDRSMGAEDLMNNSIQVVEAGAIRELFPGRIGIRELFHQLLTEPFLHLRPTRKLNESPLTK